MIFRPYLLTALIQHQGIDGFDTGTDTEVGKNTEWNGGIRSEGHKWCNIGPPDLDLT